MGKPAIFIVEDEAIVANDIKETLKGLGYTISGIAKSGETAIEKIGELRPDLVLMDIHLATEMDGVETAGKIHVLYGIPVIYLTAYADKALLDRAKITEPYGYVLKPYEEREIHSVIEMALYKNQIDRQLRQRDDTINTLLNATDNPSLLLDAHATIIALNEAMAKRAQDTAGNLIGKSFFDLLTRQSISAPLAEAVRQAGAGKKARVEENFGGVWYDSAAIPIADSDGILQSIAVQCIDISHRKDAEIALKSLNDQLVAERIRLATLDAALDSMDDPVIITDSAGRITYVNESFKTRFGYTLSDVLEKHFSTLAAPENKLSLSVDGFVMDQKSVRAGKFIARNKYGLNLAFLLKSSPLIIENQTRYRVFVLREETLGKK